MKRTCGIGRLVPRADIRAYGSHHAARPHVLPAEFRIDLARPGRAEKVGDWTDIA